MKKNDAISRMKREATNYVRLVKQEFGKSVTRSEALEKVAYLNGFPNWDTAAALGDGPSMPSDEPLPILLQYSQLQALQAGIRGGGLLVSIIGILAKQGDQRLSKGWESAHNAVKIHVDNIEQEIDSEGWSQSLLRALRETKFFDDQVLLMLEMGAEFEFYSGRCFETAIAYLETILKLSSNGGQFHGLGNSPTIFAGRGQNGALFISNQQSLNR